jgi:hypothetical protein
LNAAAFHGTGDDVLVNRSNVLRPRSPEMYTIGAPTSADSINSTHLCFQHEWQAIFDEPGQSEEVLLHAVWTIPQCFLKVP